MLIAGLGLAGAALGALLPSTARVVLPAPARHQPFPPAYRLACALALAATWAALALRHPEPAYLALYAYLGAGLVLASACDARFHLLPRRLLRPLTASVALGLVALALASHRASALIVALAWLVGTYLLAALASATRPEALGGGDVRLAALVALATGYLLVLAPLFALALASWAAALAWLARPRPRPARIALGPYLSFGAMALVVVGLR